MSYIKSKLELCKQCNKVWIIPSCANPCLICIVCLGGTEYTELRWKR